MYQRFLFISFALSTLTLVAFAFNALLAFALLFMASMFSWIMVLIFRQNKKL